MSYSISLVDKETGKTLELPTGLLAKSNNVPVKFDKNSGYFSPIAFTYAELNITYNYSKYFREANENGIRVIYGKTAEESLKILEDMKEKILEKYYDKDTCQWLISVKERNRYFDKYGNEITNPISLVFDRKKNAECTVNYPDPQGVEAC